MRITPTGTHMTEGLTIREAASALGVSHDTVRRMIRDGRIKAEKRGPGRGKYTIPESEISTFRSTRELVTVNRQVDVTEFIQQQNLELKKELQELREAVKMLVVEVAALRRDEAAQTQPAAEHIKSEVRAQEESSLWGRLKARWLKWRTEKRG